MWPIMGYVRRRKAKIAEYIATHPIFEFFPGVEQITGSSRSLRLWEQYHSQKYAMEPTKGWAVKYIEGQEGPGEMYYLA